MKHIFKTHTKKYPYSTFLFCTLIFIWICIGIFFACMIYQNKEEKSDLVNLNTEQCTFSFLDTQELSILKQDTQKVSLSVKAVSTPEDMQKGLGGVPCLPENQGMLFIFPKSEQYAFWMKDMLMPIDIIWLDESKKVIDISRNIQPDTYPNTFSPRVPAQYVLEVPASWTEKNDIQIGIVLNFLP